MTERESLGADAMLRDTVRDETRVIKAFVPSFSGNIAQRKNPFTVEKMQG